MASSCDRVVLKLKNGQEFRRVVLQARPIRLENVHGSIGQIFPSLKNEEYSLSYTDEDGDVILVSSDLELSEALQVAMSMSGNSTPILRFEVTSTGKEVAPVVQESKTAVAEIEDVDEDIEALVNDVTAELDAAKNDEPKKAEQSKDGLLLSSLVPEEILRHEFLRKMALEFRTSLDKWVALIPMINIGMRCRGDSQKLLKEACDAIIAGANMTLPSDLLQNPMAAFGLGYLQDQKDEIVQKLDRMGEGLATLEKSDLNGKMPVAQMVMMLWRHGGDADAVLKNAAFGGFCSHPPPPPPPAPTATHNAGTFRPFGFPPPFHTFQMNMHVNADSSTSEKKEERPQEPACPRRCPFMASKASCGKKLDDAEFEHPAICDHCGDNIKNIRWKCHTCADYDLCTACLSVSDVHDPTHSFIRITPQSATSHMPFRFRGHRGRRFGGHPFRFTGCRGRRFGAEMREEVERRKNAAEKAQQAERKEMCSPRQALLDSIVSQKKQSTRQALLDSIVAMSKTAEEEKEEKEELVMDEKVDAPVASVPAEEVVEAKEDEVEVLDPEVVANIAQLTNMGFAEDEARDVLAGVNNNVNEAIDILLGA